MNRFHMRQTAPQQYTTTRQEILLFAGCFLALSVLYSTPRLFVAGISREYLTELAIDCLFMAISCLPIWWLHFRTLAHWPLKRRFALHLLTAAGYYGGWVLLYQVYNPWVGKPAMSWVQVLQNVGPNLLFYIQVFSILHIYHFFHEREAQLQREKALGESAHQSEMNALKAQIQPHFLFNTLSSISASLPPDQEDTRIRIARLADTFRYALHATKETVVPLASELEFIQAYLTLEKARFGKRLQFRIESSPRVDQVAIPPMLLQPLVENALKHAIEPALEGGEIVIRCTPEGDKIRFVVSNTGNPFRGSLDGLLQGDGIGLTNTARRLEQHYGEPLRIEQNAFHGLRITFCIPDLTSAYPS